VWLGAQGGDRGAAGRPAREVRRRVDAERLEQRAGVVRPVVQAAGRVDGLGLAAPEAAHVGRDQAEALGRAGHEVLVEAPGREVAV
jgi:hypothetical protein